MLLGPSRLRDWDRIWLALNSVRDSGLSIPPLGFQTHCADCTETISVRGRDRTCGDASSSQAPRGLHLAMFLSSSRDVWHSGSCTRWVTHPHLLAPAQLGGLDSSCSGQRSICTCGTDLQRATAKDKDRTHSVHESQRRDADTPQEGGHQRSRSSARIHIAGQRCGGVSESRRANT